MNIEKFTQKLSVHEKTLKIPTRHMATVLSMLDYFKQQTKKGAEK
tara:strand:- start:18 stop:152 length:135 start_codon:yes stop_codon:yes gene_type:complete